MLLTRAISAKIQVHLNVLLLPQALHSPLIFFTQLVLLPGFFDLKSSFMQLTIPTAIMTLIDQLIDLFLVFVLDFTLR